MPQNSNIPTSWKLLPVNVDFPSFDGKYSISKLNEEERQRNSELQELDEQQNPQNNERQEPKLIPLEYTGEIDDDSDENEMLESNNSEDIAVENNRNYEDDCNINDSRFYLSSTSQLYKTPQSHHGSLSSSFSQPYRGLKSILKRPSESHFCMNNSSSYLHTNTIENMDRECGEIVEVVCIKKSRKKPSLNRPPSPTGSEPDGSVAYQNNLIG